MSHLLPARKAQPDVGKNADGNPHPLEREGAFAHEADRNHDGKERGQRTNRRRNRKRHMRDSIVGKEPAKAHDDRLRHQQQVVVQRKRLAEAQGQEREHEQGVKGATEAENRADGIVLHRFFLRKIIKAQKNSRSESQNQP